MHTSERMFNYLHNYTSSYFKVNTGYYRRVHCCVTIDVSTVNKLCDDAGAGWNTRGAEYQ